MPQLYTDTREGKVYRIGGMPWKALDVDEAYRQGDEITITDRQGISVTIKESDPTLQALLNERIKILREIAKQKRDEDKNLWHDYYMGEQDKKGKKQ